MVRQHVPSHVRSLFEFSETDADHSEFSGDLSGSESQENSIKISNDGTETDSVSEAPNELSVDSEQKCIEASLLWAPKKKKRKRRSFRRKAEFRKNVERLEKHVNDLLESFSQIKTEYFKLQTKLGLKKKLKDDLNKYWDRIGEPSFRAKLD